MIGVLTYNIPHRKTQDVLFRLKALVDEDVIVVIMPFVNRPVWKPLFQHRPSLAIEMLPSVLATKLNYKYFEVSDLLKFLKSLTFNLEPIIIAGAGILDSEVVENWKVVNTHPGYLPYGRGLDSLKWSIYNNWPIGCTTHLVSQDVDAGLLVEQIKTKIYPLDSFYSLAIRHYELEIEMLVSAIQKYRFASKLLPIHFCDDAGLEEVSPIYKRMPHDKEIIMLKRLDKRIMDLNPEFYSFF